MTPIFMEQWFAVCDKNHTADLAVLWAKLPQTGTLLTEY